MSEKFDDPVVRCTDCQTLITRDEIRKFGMCPSCGTRRMRNVVVLSAKEMQELRNKDISPEFLAEFEVKNG